VCAEALHGQRQGRFPPPRARRRAPPPAAPPRRRTPRAFADAERGARGQAYETLSNAESRKKYDTFGDMEDLAGGGGGGFGFGGFEQGFDPFNVFQQVFEQHGAGGFGGPFGGGEYVVYQHEADHADLASCVQDCVMQYRQAGYRGDLQGHCVDECEQVPPEAGPWNLRPKPRAAARPQRVGAGWR
jgi:hypothetical protein